MIILVVVMASGLAAEAAKTAESRKMVASIQLIALVDRLTSYIFDIRRGIHVM